MRQIHGANFDATEKWLCEFGGLTVKAVLLSRSRLTCITPPSTFLVPREVEFNIHRYVYNESSSRHYVVGNSPVNDDHDSLSFEYREEISLVSVEPSVVFTSRRTILRVSFLGYAESSELSCIWTHPKDVQIVREIGMTHLVDFTEAKLLNESLIACSTPPIY